MQWRKVIGVAIIALGIGLTGRGLGRWNEPPLDPGRRYVHVSSRQILDVTAGPACVLFGIIIYRRGWKAFERPSG
jgi:hypothetical protein